MAVPWLFPTEKDIKDQMTNKKEFNSLKEDGKFYASLKKTLINSFKTDVMLLKIENDDQLYDYIFKNIEPFNKELINKLKSRFNDVQNNDKKDLVKANGFYNEGCNLMTNWNMDEARYCFSAVETSKK